MGASTLPALCQENTARNQKYGRFDPARGTIFKQEKISPARPGKSRFSARPAPVHPSIPHFFFFFIVRPGPTRPARSSARPYPQITFFSQARPGCPSPRHNFAPPRVVFYVMITNRFETSEGGERETTKVILTASAGGCLLGGCYEYLCELCI